MQDKPFDISEGATISPESVNNEAAIKFMKERRIAVFQYFNIPGIWQAAQKELERFNSEPDLPIREHIVFQEAAEMVAEMLVNQEWFDDVVSAVVSYNEML